MRLYEHLHIDISPNALAFIADRLEAAGCMENAPADLQYEVQNFINECRARVQHAAIGMPDRADEYEQACEKAIAEMPPVKVEEDWLA